MRTKSVTGKLQGRDHMGALGVEERDNIETDLQEIICEGAD
jgi:hypothetical protein